MRHWRSVRINGEFGFHVDQDGHRPAGRHPHPARYESDVLGVLSRVAANPAGAAVLDLICAQSHHLVILAVVNDFAAQTSANDAMHSVAAGIPIRSRIHKHEYIHDEGGRILFGLGGGSNTRIFFTPDTFRHGREGMTPEEVLAHELFHALGDLRGVLEANMNTGDVYDNQEEFCAVLFENIFNSSGGRSDMRFYHNHSRTGFAPDLMKPFARAGIMGSLLHAGADRVMDNPFRNLGATSGPTLSQRYAEQYAERIRGLWHRERELCLRLATLSCSFNPIRDLAGAH